MRSPTIPSLEFFPSVQEETRLLSPPPSSPAVRPRNVYAINEHDVYSSAIMPPRKDNLRQTRLDEYRNGYVPVIPQPPLERTTNRANDLAFPPQIRSTMGYHTNIGEMDSTEGIVSSRRPRTRQIEISELNDITTEIQHSQNNLDNIARYGLPDIIDDIPPQTTANRREPRTRNPPSTNFKDSASPRMPKVRKSQLHNSHTLCSPPQLPPTPPRQIKQRPLSESPAHIVPPTFETSLNPWTIAAMNPPSKRPRIESNDYRHPTYRTATIPDGYSEDMFVDCYCDMILQKRVLICRVSIEEVAVGQFVLLSHVPPTCDLSDYLMQYCSSF